MAYDVSKLATLSHLKALAEKVKAGFAAQEDFDKLSEQVAGIVETGGEANVLEGVKVNGTALSIAEKMVDILIKTGSANGTISVNGADVAIKGLAALAYKAKVSESDLDTALATAINGKASASELTALTTTVTTLVGSDTGKSARTIANEELAKQLIPANAGEALDTLTEIAAWIQEHPDDAAAMNADIAALKALVADLPEGKTVAAYVDEQITELSGDVVHTSDIASDTEVTEMLTEVFG